MANTIIGNSIVIDGEISGDEDLVIQGTVKGKIGEVSEVGPQSFFVTAQGGRIEVLKAKLGDGKKIAASELAASSGIQAGTLLGT